MKRLIYAIWVLVIAVMVISCNDTNASAEESNEKENRMAALKDMPMHEKLGYESEVAYGKHFVTVLGCDDCHTPKKMTEHGPEPDLSKRMMGHPADLPPPVGEFDELLAGGNVLMNGHLTAFVGPWGITYSANLTPHETGLGNWTKEQWNKAMREGKHKGLDGGRNILPPMPWFNLAKMTDEELSAVFAFLKSLEPIDNKVPEPELFERPQQAMK